MASRNGLNPKIRGPKGVGFGRALPAAFGFGLSFQGDGVNDYFALPTLVGKSIPTQITIEFWIFPLADVGTFLSYFSFKSPTNTLTALFTESSKLWFTPSDLDTVPCGTLAMNAWNHIVFTCDFEAGMMRCVTNGDIASNQVSFSGFTPDTIGSIALYGTIGGGYATQPIDEFRFYDKILTDDQIATNYNDGSGNNPAVTEHLICWYQFEKFENIDFSDLQDGSNIMLGMRDMSGKNNHGQPLNMDTNPTSGTYVLRNL